MDILMSILYIVYIVLAWMGINYLQGKLGWTFFMNMRGFFMLMIWKFLLASLFGWIIIPVALLLVSLEKR